VKTLAQLQTISGWRMTVVLDTSFSASPLTVQLNITNPVALAAGGYRSTLHMHARDDTQTPFFNGDLVAIGNATDADTLLGGLLPAAMVVEKDLAACMTFEQAAADAHTRTGVTVTFFNDPTEIEYAVMLMLTTVACVTEFATVSPGLHDDACTMRSDLQAGLAAGGFQTPPDACVIHRNSAEPKQQGETKS
jgi:hypothetical protein